MTRKFTGEESSGERTPHQKAHFFRFKEWNNLTFKIASRDRGPKGVEQQSFVRNRPLRAKARFSIQPPEMGSVVAMPQVGGLHHRYERRAA